VEAQADVVMLLSVQSTERLSVVFCSFTTASLVRAYHAYLSRRRLVDTSDHHRHRNRVVDRLRVAYVHLLLRSASVTWNLALNSAPKVYTCWHQYWLVALVAILRTGQSPPCVVGLDNNRGRGLQRAYAAIGGSMVLLSDRSTDSRRDVLARQAVVATIKRGGTCLITPDGPRGPRYVPKSGATRLAAIAGVPLVELEITVRHTIACPRWDRFCLPLPLVHITVSRP
jgi:lysophospholipid acyltransferase (LPLAT)-like uncharacterized protein